MPRLRRAIALAVATSALLATATVVHVAPAAARSDTCADVAFLGARGSGEPPGLGMTVQDTADRYQNRVDSLASVEIHPVVYPAVSVLDSEFIEQLRVAVSGLRADPWRWLPGPLPRQSPLTGPHQPSSSELLQNSRVKYDNSVIRGATNLRAQLSSLAMRCSNTRFVLAGYSQGAHAVNRFLESVDTSNPVDRGLAERIIGIALFGSPVFAQYDPPEQVNRSRWGPAPYSFLRQGVYQTLNDAPIGVPSILARQPWVTKSHSYCLARDVVCQASSPLYRLFQFFGVDEGPSSIEPHLHYRDYYTDDAAGWLAGRTVHVLRSHHDPRVALPR